MSDSLLIKNPKIVRPDGLHKASVFIEKGKITSIGEIREAEQVIDAEHLLLFPGVIDTHVHFREPGMEHKETIASGSKAAAKGGVTSFLDMPNNNPFTTTKEALAAKLAIAAETSLVNYGFFIGANTNNVDLLNDIDDTPGIKLFLGSSTGSMLLNTPELLDKLFSQSGSKVIAVHAEDEDTILHNRKNAPLTGETSDHLLIRSADAALKAVQQITELAEKYQKRVHLLHITSKEEVDFLLNLKSELVTAETCPQHFLLSAPEDYKRLKNLIKVNPPIRYREDNDALIEALKKGAIHTLATDHAPHTLKEKNRAYEQAPSGMPGIETFLPLMLEQVHQGYFSLQDLSILMSLNPSRVYGIQNKGLIAEGMDADLVLIDFYRKEKISDEKIVSKCGWTAFKGMETSGWPVTTIVNGETVYHDGEFTGVKAGKQLIFS